MLENYRAMLWTAIVLGTISTTMSIANFAYRLGHKAAQSDAEFCISLQATEQARCINHMLSSSRR